MAKAKRVRWECPTGEHPGQLASSRPPKNATVRYCIPCSMAEGVLVERVAPALVRKRAAKQAQRIEREQRQREADREARASRHLVTVLDRDGQGFVLDAGVLLAEAWRTEELRAQQRESFLRGRGRVPELIIRRGGADAGRLVRREEHGRHPRSRPIRDRDAMSGHAKGSGEKIVLTVRPGLGHEWLRAVIVHEAAHAACKAGEHHGSGWRGAYIRAVRELYGFEPGFTANEGPSWDLDERIAEAILDARRS